MGKRLLALLMVVLAPALAWAQGASDRVRERAQARGLSAAEVEALVAPVAQAEASGLPPEPVAEKVLEGLAKGVPPARVASAAQAVQGRLADAKSALQQAGLAPEGRAIAGLALAESRLGPRELLLKLAERSRGASAEALVAAASAAAELKASGLPPEQAAENMAELASRGYRADQLASVPRLYGQYRAEGGADPAAFWAELGRRSERHADLQDLVDPFGKGGEVLRHGEGRGQGGSSVRAEAAGRSADHSSGGSLFENPDRAGSTPANDQVVPGPKGGLAVKPGKPASKGPVGPGKGKGASGNQDLGHQGNNE